MKRTTRGVRSVPPFSSLPSLLFPLFSTVSRVRTKYLHVNVGHVSRAIPCFAATWTDTSRERIQRSVIENGTRETEPGPALLRFVRSFVRSSRSNLRAGPRLNGRVEFACETNRYFIQTACSLPVILSPYRSNLRRLLPFSVSPLFPCRAPNSLSVARDKPPRTTPCESFAVTSVISTDYFNLESRFFFLLLPFRFHLRISNVGQIG